MILKIIRDAVHIKMELKNESPLISVPEFSYAAGLGCHIMEMDTEQVKQLLQIPVFQDMKEQIQHLAKESEKFADYPNGNRLQSLIVGCRIRGEMLDEAKELFEMGFVGK